MFQVVCGCFRDWRITKVISQKSFHIRIIVCLLLPENKSKISWFSWNRSSFDKHTSDQKSVFPKTNSVNCSRFYFKVKCKSWSGKMESNFVEVVIYLNGFHENTKEGKLELEKLFFIFKRSHVSTSFVFLKYFSRVQENKYQWYRITQMVYLVWWNCLKLGQYVSSK